MAAKNAKMLLAVETYFVELGRVRSSGGGTGELSYYPALDGHLRAVGGSLKPRVHPVNNLANRGAGHPDFGLFTAKQVRKGRPREGQVPERGVVEVKPIGDDAW